MKKENTGTAESQKKKSSKKTDWKANALAKLAIIGLNKADSREYRTAVQYLQRYRTQIGGVWNTFTRTEEQHLENAWSIVLGGIEKSGKKTIA